MKSAQYQLQTGPFEVVSFVSSIVVYQPDEELTGHSTGKERHGQTNSFLT